ncbi:MAG: hypothetical protein WDW36_003322 [Sanguina aurantia]
MSYQNDNQQQQNGPRRGGGGGGRGPRPTSAVGAPSQRAPYSNSSINPAPPRQQQQQRAFAVQAPIAQQADDMESEGSDLDTDAALPTVDKKYLTDKKFADFQISAESKRALKEVLGYTFCSQVQADALPECLGPKDVMAKARTGTGKTLAFVIPTIEKILRTPAPQGKISALILSPTRELARQIMVETTKMLTHHRNLSTMVIYGGVDVKKNMNAIRARVPDIMIATPGRCYDVMTQARLFDSVKVLVFDEADSLLDMGFRPQISKILALLPPPAQRQTYLFSATFPTDVKQLVNTALRPQHTFVDSVGDAVDTHVHIDQSFLVVPQQQLAVQLYHLLTRHMREEPEFKVIVFLSTANLTAFYAQTFQAMGLPVLEMHSRKSQTQRDRTSEEFRKATRSIMFSSDVSARGVDYPNVSYVIQLGAPSNKEQFIHRSGRTGRAGKSGSCALLLAGFEAPFLAKLRELPMQELAAVASSPTDPSEVAVTHAIRKVDESVRSKAYSSFLGYYKSHAVIKTTPAQIVQIANEYSRVGMELATPPAISAQTIGKMGLRGVPGLNVEKGPSGSGQQSRGGGGGRGGGNGGGGGRGGGGGGSNSLYEPQQQQRQEYGASDSAAGSRRPAQQQGGRPQSAAPGGGGGYQQNGGGGGGYQQSNAGQQQQQRRDAPYEFNLPAQPGGGGGRPQSANPGRGGGGGRGEGGAGRGAGRGGGRGGQQDATGTAANALAGLRF